MLDWLNTKAAISISVVVLILISSSWFDICINDLEKQELETELIKFVNAVNRVAASSAFVKINVSFTVEADDPNQIKISPTFQDELYEIIITNTFAVFKQGQLRVSEHFVSPVILCEEFHCLEAGEIINHGNLSKTSIIKSYSNTAFEIMKISISIKGTIQVKVVIFHL